MKPYGENANDLVIEVPCGISAILAENNAYLGEVNKDNDTLVIAQGGAGGTAKNMFVSENGEKIIVYLDLKLIADVALIGYVE